MDKKTVKKLTKAEQEKAKKQIIHNMECEKMLPSSQDLKNIDAVLSGEKSVEKVIAEEEQRMKDEGLIK